MSDDHPPRRFEEDEAYRTRVRVALEALTRELLKSQARAAALEALVLTLAEGAGWDEAECRATLRAGAALAFEKALERLEDIDPGLAGDLDNRPGAPPTSD